MGGSGGSVGPGCPGSLRGMGCTGFPLGLEVIDDYVVNGWPLCSGRNDGDFTVAPTGTILILCQQKDCVGGGEGLENDKFC